MSVAGCVGDGFAGWTGGDAVLNGIVINNFTQQDRTVEIVVEDAERTYVDREVVAAAMEYDRAEDRMYGGATLACDWPGTSGTYRARARLAGETEWVAIESTDEYDEGCELFEFVVEDYGLDVTARPCRGQAYACGYDE